MKYAVVKITSLRQDGNGKFIEEKLCFDSRKDAENYIAKHENGWVHFSQIESIMTD